MCQPVLFMPSRGNAVMPWLAAAPSLALVPPAGSAVLCSLASTSSPALVPFVPPAAVLWLAEGCAPDPCCVRDSLLLNVRSQRKGSARPPCPLRCSSPSCSASLQEHHSSECLCQSTSAAQQSPSPCSSSLQAHHGSMQLHSGCGGRLLPSSIFKATSPMPQQARQWNTMVMYAAAGEPGTTGSAHCGLPLCRSPQGPGINESRGLLWAPAVNASGD